MARLDFLLRLLNDHKLNVSIVVIVLSTFSSANPPVIDFSHNMRILKLPNNTKVGSIIYRIKGTDADNDVIEFGVRGPIGRRLLSFKRVNFYESDVYLKIPLEEKKYEITIYASDGKQETEVESTILVTQTSDSSESAFLPSENIVKIPESTSTNETITTISVREKENSNLPVTFELRGSNKFGIKYIFGPGGTSNAEIYLIEKLDYEKQNLYVLTIVALNVWTNETFDTRNVAVIDKVVAVVDIQDTPPLFLNLPNVVKISENTKVGNIIFTLSAEDGDYGNQRNITYEIEQKSPLRSYFAIHENEGSIVLRRPVQDIKQEIGTKEPMILIVRAIEVISSEDTIPPMLTDSSIVLVIVSTDNRPPIFKSQHLIGNIDENSQPMTPVKWEGMSELQVNDDDPGLNGTMILDISDPSDTFMIQPKRGINKIIFSIVVKDMKKLDYESNADKQFLLKITATDQSPYIQLNSTILCTIKLIDLNDNTPQFSQRIYEAFISEDSLPGTTVTKVEAIDQDGGDFGRFRYTSLNGPLSKNLQIDSETGIILLKNNENIDREMISEYRMTIEARDDLGRGNKNVTELLIKIVDSNDNAPMFLQPRYDAVLNPDRFSFTQPLIVKALDADQPNTVNSNVSYEIIGGNYQNKFVINKNSGEITLNSVLIDDKNFKIADNIPNEYQSVKFLPVLILMVRAHDHGIPYQSSTVPVYIHNPDFLNRTVTFTIGDSEQNVIKRKELIESGMSTLSGAKVHIYSIRPHSNKEMTEVLAWMAYPSQSSVDLNKTPLILSQIIGKEYSIGETKEFNTTQIAGNDFRLIFWLLIILILSTLIFLIIFLICWFCCCRDRIRREKLRESEETNYMKAVNGSVVRDKTLKHKKSKLKKRSSGSVQAWNEEFGSERIRPNSFRPSSAPNNEQNHYIRNIRANSSQSFPEQYVPNNPTLYQRVHKLNRHQRTRVVPQYYDSYDTNDIHSSLSDYRNPYNSIRLQSNQMRSFKGTDNLGYLRTTNEPYIIDDMNGHNSSLRVRPVVQHLPYNEKLATLPKRTEILYIQSPVTETQEDMLRSISQNEMPYIGEQEMGQYLDVSQSSAQNMRESERMKNSKPKQRHIYFTDHRVSDLVIPEEMTVPGMVPKDSQQNNELIMIESVSGAKQNIHSSETKQKVVNERLMNGREKSEDITSSDSKELVQNRDENELINSENENLIPLERSADNGKEIINESQYYDETIQITSVSGVPVSIELKEGLKVVENTNKVNESLINSERRNNKNKRTLTKENSFETSEKSYDSDSGIGRSVLNPQINFDMKNSGLMEKKSIFTIAYNDVKTRHLQSAESNAE